MLCVVREYIVALGAEEDRCLLLLLIALILHGLAHAHVLHLSVRILHLVWIIVLLLPRLLHHLLLSWLLLVLLLLHVGVVLLLHLLILHGLLLVLLLLHVRVVLLLLLLLLTLALTLVLVMPHWLRFCRSQATH